MPLLLLIALLSWMAAAQAQAAMRLPMQDAARYLELRPDQQGRLLEIDAAWQRDLAEADRREQAIAQLAEPAREPARERLCAATRQRLQQAERDARALLDGTQNQRLATLEQAMSLLPVIESAQAAHLLPPALRAAPAGLPEGQVELSVRYVRADPPRLPGCPARLQTVRPGTERGGAEPPRRSPP